MHFLFGAGGTGGHLYPALAVAEALRKIDKNFKITFTGRLDKIEGVKVKEFGFDFLPIDIRPISFSQGFSAIKNLVRFYSAIRKITKFIKTNNCNAVIVGGAYISIPPGISAIRNKIPLFLMESNVNPGKAISLLTARSKAIFTSFQNSYEYFPDKFQNKIYFAGNPLRSSFDNKINQNDAKIKLGFSPVEPLILVFGGSLGAESINNFITNNYEKFAEKSINIAWQTGLGKNLSINLPSGIKIYSFIDDMASFYAAADLVISRSGASTISELSICKKPSILIPYPSASNNEQLRNAETLEKKNAAICVLDKDIHSNLFNIVINTIFDTNKLLELSENISQFAMPGAAQIIANKILENINYESRK